MAYGYEFYDIDDPCWFTRELKRRGGFIAQRTTRLINCLRNGGIPYREWKDDSDVLQAWNYEKLCKIPNFGRECFNLVKNAWHIPEPEDKIEVSKLEAAWREASQYDRLEFLESFKLFRVEDRP